MKTGEQSNTSTEKSSRMFIHSSLDDAGLRPNEFRVLAHLSRRSGKDGRCDPGIRSIAAVCRMGKGTAERALDELEKKGFIAREKRTKAVANYSLTLAIGISQTVPPQGQIQHENCPATGTDDALNCPKSERDLSQIRARSVPPQGQKVIQKEIPKGNPPARSLLVGSAPAKRLPTATTNERARREKLPQEEWLNELRAENPKIDIDAEFRAYVPHCEKKGKPATRLGFEGWLKHASQTVEVPEQRFSY